MKNIKLFEEFTNEGKIKDWFYDEMPDDQKRKKPVGKRMKDWFYDKESQVFLTYTEDFRENLYDISDSSLIAKALLDIENNYEFPFTNIDIVDNENVSYTDVKDKTEKEISLIEFAKKALSHRRFTDKSFRIFARKYKNANDLDTGDNQGDKVPGGIDDWI